MSRNYYSFNGQNPQEEVQRHGNREASASEEALGSLETHSQAKYHGGRETYQKDEDEEEAAARGS
jgi:hypothetical protein